MQDIHAREVQCRAADELDSGGVGGGELGRLGGGRRKLVRPVGLLRHQFFLTILLDTSLASCSLSLVLFAVLLALLVS